MLPTGVIRMRSRIIAFLTAAVLRLAYATTMQSGGAVTTIHGFPDDPGVSAASE